MTTITEARTYAWRTRVSGRGVLVLAAAMMAGLSVAAAETPEQRQACMDDAFQFCSEAIPDRERVFACLVEKRTMISPLCREGMAAFLPPEPAPAVQRVNRTPPKTKASKKTKTDTKTKPDTKIKAASKKAGAPLSLAPKTP